MMVMIIFIIIMVIVTATTAPITITVIILITTKVMTATTKMVMTTISSVQFSPLTEWVVEGKWGTIQQISGGPCEQLWHGQGCSFFDPTFPLLPTTSPTRQGALKNGFGETVVACDMPEPLQVCKKPCMDNNNMFQLLQPLLLTLG